MKEKKIDVAGLQSKNGTQDFLNMKPSGRQQKFTIKLMVTFTGMIIIDMDQEGLDRNLLFE
jgi:hypothetical protein